MNDWVEYSYETTRQRALEMIKMGQSMLENPVETRPGPRSLTSLEYTDNEPGYGFDAPVDKKEAELRAKRERRWERECKCRFQESEESYRYSQYPKLLSETQIKYQHDPQAPNVMGSTISMRLVDRKGKEREHKNVRIASNTSAPRNGRRSSRYRSTRGMDQEESDYKFGKPSHSKSHWGQGYLGPVITC